MDLFTTFAGHINRGKFWLGNLVVIGFGIAFYVANTYFLGGPFAVATPEDVRNGADPMIWGSTPAVAAYAVQSIIAWFASLAIIVKRFHDRGKSGWWALILLIPIVGLIWMIIDLGVMEGDEGPNKYGPNPLSPQTSPIPPSGVVQR